MTIRLVNENGESVGQCETYSIRTDELEEDNRFGRMESIFLPNRAEDVTMTVTNFKTPVGLLVTQQEIDLLVRCRKLEGNLAGANKIIVALVKMMGGAVSLSSAELDGADAQTLEADTMANDGLMIRVKDPV